ncbi:hypothetical protein Hdeb2414_s0001g00012201 [Helianthus debilis subsp. tardiflorus]
MILYCHDFQVPLDYSVRSYLEVIFLDPRMKIKVQGSLAYKRVGSMIHNGENSHGLVGVIDVTDVMLLARFIMQNDSGRVWVHNNKQAFVDCIRRNISKI